MNLLGAILGHVLIAAGLAMAAEVMAEMLAPVRPEFPVVLVNMLFVTGMITTGASIIYEAFREQR